MMDSTSPRNTLLPTAALLTMKEQKLMWMAIWRKKMMPFCLISYIWWELSLYFVEFVVRESTTLNGMEDSREQAHNRPYCPRLTPRRPLTCLVSKNSWLRIPLLKILSLRPANVQAAWPLSIISALSSGVPVLDTQTHTWEHTVRPASPPTVCPLQHWIMYRPATRMMPGSRPCLHMFYRLCVDPTFGGKWE